MSIDGGSDCESGEVFGLPSMHFLEAVVGSSVNLTT